MNGSSGQTNAKREGARERGEEKNGTYNPDASLMQSQASPWSSALAEAAQRSLVSGNGCTHIHTHTAGRGKRGYGSTGREEGDKKQGEKTKG